MSSLPGGPAEKAGAIYEALWGVRALLEVLHGSADRVRVEEPRIDGAEFWIERGGQREYWQIKRQLLSQATWTLNALAREGVLTFFLEQLRVGGRCVFASITDAPELRTLAERARDAMGAMQNQEPLPGEFLEKFIVEEKWREQFDNLRRFWGDANELEAFSLLSRIEVRSADEYTLSQDLICSLGTMFDSPGATTLDCLRVFYGDRVHHSLTADAIRLHLKERGIGPRVFIWKQKVFNILEAITKTYISGQKAKLIRGQIIPRALSREIVEIIVEAQVGKDILVIGAAGSGKSGCLLEIIDELLNRGLSVLAFRLDRLSPVQTTLALGGELGLPESPVLVLARAFPMKKVVIVVDQLDCVSTTSGRHPEFFDTLAALLSEVRGLRADAEIHLLLACRKFDYDHDSRFRALLPENERPHEVANLTKQEVDIVLKADGGDSNRLTLQQLDLLFLPQNLSLFVDSGLVRDRKSAFTSQKDLFDAYWHRKRMTIEKGWSAEASQWLPVIETLVGEMNETQEISVPKGRLDMFSPHFLDVMVSEGVLTFDGRRYGFGHESFFDYCFARLFARGQQELADFLEDDDQHLFRRAQTRQVLVYLRDDKRARYLLNVATLLASKKIRAHLKLLVLGVITAFPDPDDNEWAIMLPLIDAELDCCRRGVVNPNKIATRAFDLFRASNGMFNAADRLGYIKIWLHSGESFLEDIMVTYLSWQTSEHSDRVIELIEPFVGRGGAWTGRLRYMVEGRELGKNRRYFELFLRLLEDGTLDGNSDQYVSNSIFWSILYGLAREQPRWCAEAASLWLSRKVERALAAREEGQLLRISMHDEAGVRELFESARAAPDAFLFYVIPAIIHAAESALFPEKGGLPRDSIWPFRVTGEYVSLCSAYLGACEAAFQVLGNKNPDILRSFALRLRSSRTYIANSLLLSAYSEGPEIFAEEAIALLCEEPERLECGYSDSSHWGSRCLIEKLSPYCSDQRFAMLEHLLREYTTAYERGNGHVDIGGLASFTLLSALPIARCNPRTIERLVQLEARFGKPEFAPQGVRAYTIVSPISKEDAREMTDDEWLGAIERHRGVGRRYDKEHPELGGEQELAGMMQGFVRKDPERFARLALRFPSGIASCYWMNVLHGLEEARIPALLKLEVARRVYDLDESACLMAAVELLTRIVEEFLPLDAINFLKRLAMAHPDPERELWRAEKEGDPAYFNGDILTCGINTVRGRVAERLRNLIVSDQRYLVAFLPAIESLIRDPSTSVRACTVSALFGIAHHDEELAVSFFQVLIEGDEFLLGTGYAEDFIRRGLSTHIAVMRRFVERALGSSQAGIVQIGGRLAAIARLMHAGEDALTVLALDSGSAGRLGLAEVAECNITSPDCREWCEEMLSILFNDDEKAVQQKAAHCFWHLWHKPDVPLELYAKLIACFLKSKAFVTSPTMLLHTLENSRHKLPETVLDICEQFVDRCANEARDVRTRHAGDEASVGPLVFRAYQQLASSPGQLRALRLIDRMSEEGLQSVRRGLMDFER